MIKKAGYLLVACARSLQRAPSASEIIIRPWQPVFLAPKLQDIVKNVPSKKVSCFEKSTFRKSRKLSPENVHYWSRQQGLSKLGTSNHSGLMWGFFMSISKRCVRVEVQFGNEVPTERSRSWRASVKRKVFFYNRCEKQSMKASVYNV